MLINPTTSLGVVPVRRDVRGLSPSGASPALSGSLDEANLTGTDKLTQALHDVADIRTDEVARAQGLIGSVKYPPIEVIDSISRLLARDWPGANSEGSDT